MTLATLEKVESPRLLFAPPPLRMPTSRRALDPRNKLGAATDGEAIRLFLEDRAARSERTAHEYSRELARLLLWLGTIQRTLNTLTHSDLKDYLALLADEDALRAFANAQPSTEARATVERVYAINDKRWATRARSPDARVNSARPAIASLLKWLSERGYMSRLALPRAPNAGFEHGRDPIAAFAARVHARKLPSDAWLRIDQAIETLRWSEPDEALERAILIWLRWTGARRAEIARARTSHVFVLEDGNRTETFWRVYGKGGRERSVPLNSDMMHAYRRYLLSRGGVLPEQRFMALGDRPLFEIDVTGRKRRGVIGADVYRAVKRISKAASVSTLSPHAFRHRRAFELNRIRDSDLAQFLGHASTQTTQIYSSSALLDFAEAINQA